MDAAQVGGHKSGSGQRLTRHTREILGGTASGLSLPADWHAGETAKLPVLLIHGGGWVSLDRTSVRGLADVIAGEGHPVLNIDYRLADESPWPACLDDCLAAARWLLKKYPRILVCGASAGGHLALMTAAKFGSAQVAGACSISGITIIRSGLPSSGALFSKDGLTALFGHAPSVEECRGASPVDQVKPGFPPVMLIHSEPDALVPMDHSAAMQNACQQAGVSVGLVAFRGEGTSHGIWESKVGIRRPVAAVREALQTWLQETRG